MESKNSNLLVEIVNFLLFQEIITRNKLEAVEAESLNRYLKANSFLIRTMNQQNKRNLGDL